MKDNYDFSNAIKNPFAGRDKGKYNVTIYCDNIDTDAENAEDAKHVNDELQITVQRVLKQ